VYLHVDIAEARANEYAAPGGLSLARRTPLVVALNVWDPREKHVFVPGSAEARGSSGAGPAIPGRSAWPDPARGLDPRPELIVVGEPDRAAARAHVAETVVKRPREDAQLPMLPRNEVCHTNL
jgi:hypothetical protein